MRGGLSITTYPKRQFTLKYQGAKKKKCAPYVIMLTTEMYVSVYVCLSMHELHSNDSGISFFLFFSVSKFHFQELNYVLN